MFVFVSDLSHIIRINNVGAKIYVDKIPVSSQLKSYCNKRKKGVMDFTLYGGEDYALLFTIDPANINLIKKYPLLKKAVCIGSVTETKEIELSTNEDNVIKIDRSKIFQPS